MAENPIRRIAKELDKMINDEVDRFNNLGVDLDYTTAGRVIAEKLRGTKEVQVTRKKRGWLIKF